MAQAACVIAFPTEKITFEPIKFGTGKVSILSKYQDNAQYVAFCQKFLEMTPERMKRDIVGLRKKIGRDDVISNMISDFENVAKDCLALNEMFTAAAARLTAAERGLI